jgi:hypothetical protein
MQSLNAPTLQDQTGGIGGALHAGISPSPWYTNWSLWLAVIGIATLLATVVFWLLGRIDWPRRLITYEVIMTSLLTTQLKGLTGDIQIMRDGRVLKDPYVVYIRLDYRSRKDLSSDDFDQGKPILFEFGAQIVNALGGTVTPDAAGAGSTCLSIGPALVRRGRLARVTLLVEGQPRVRVQNPLANVKLKDQSPGAQASRRTRLRAAQGWLVLVAAAAVAIASGVFVFLTAPHH